MPVRPPSSWPPQHACSGSGVRVAVVLNDQGDDLVDTLLVESRGVPAGQVAGGCFCCRFPDLIEALDSLTHLSPEVIFAEAVGSCTDIVAHHPAPPSARLPTPIASCVTPFDRHPASRRALADPDLQFLYENQMAEADVLIGRGSTLLSGARRVDAATGEGVAEWLEEILAGTLPVAAHPLTLDYARYAAAEASLAWLNARVTARAATPISPAMLVGPLLDRLSAVVPNIVHLETAGAIEFRLSGRPLSLHRTRTPWWKVRSTPLPTASMKSC